MRIASAKQNEKMQHAAQQEVVAVVKIATTSFSHRCISLLAERYF
jgi:hypothetical protein